jgi:hypothetical protein
MNTQRRSPATRAGGTILVLGLLALTSAAGDSSSGEWHVIASTGAVETSMSPDSGDWRPLSRGQSLPPLSEIRTGRSGRVTLALGESLIIVDPRTRVSLPAAMTEGEPTRVYQENGAARYRVERRPGQKFEVVTPFLVAGVKGTEFKVDVSSRATRVSVLEGIVNVASPFEGRDADIHAGWEATLDSRSGSALHVQESRGGEGVTGDLDAAVEKAAGEVTLSDVVDRSGALNADKDFDSDSRREGKGGHGDGQMEDGKWNDRDDDSDHGRWNGGDDKSFPEPIEPIDPIEPIEPAEPIVPDDPRTDPALGGNSGKGSANSGSSGSGSSGPGGSR